MCNRMVFQALLQFFNSCNLFLDCLQVMEAIKMILSGGFPKNQDQ